MSVTIRKYAHGDDGLWADLGPFLASREVHAELGGPIYSSDQTTWFIARDGSRTVGFASLRRTKSATHYDYDYVAPSHRGQGVFTRLAAARDALATEVGLPLQTLVCAARWKNHKQHGWKKLSLRGQWLRLGKDKL